MKSFSVFKKKLSFDTDVKQFKYIFIENIHTSLDNLSENVNTQFFFGYKSHDTCKFINSHQNTYLFLCDDCSPNTIKKINTCIQNREFDIVYDKNHNPVVVFVSNKKHIIYVSKHIVVFDNHRDDLKIINIDFECSSVECVPSEEIELVSNFHENMWAQLHLANYYLNNFAQKAKYIYENILYNTDANNQIKYMCCLKLKECYEKLKLEDPLQWCHKSIMYDTCKKRTECLYMLISHQTWTHDYHTANELYNIIKDNYECLDSFTYYDDILYPDYEIYTFYMPYYVLIFSYYVNYLDTNTIKNVTNILFKYQIIGDTWYMNNIMHNLAFYEKNIDLFKLEKYIDFVYDNIPNINQENNIVKKIIHKSNIAIYNSFPFHFEMFAFIIEYCKYNQLSLNIYTNMESDLGYISFYKNMFSDDSWKPRFINYIFFSNESKYDYIFITTDDDFKFKFDFKNTICINHVSYYRNNNFKHYFSIRPFSIGEMIPVSIPCFQYLDVETKMCHILKHKNEIHVFYIEPRPSHLRRKKLFDKIFKSVYEIHIHVISRHFHFENENNNNIFYHYYESLNTTKMYEIASFCQYMICFIDENRCERNYGFSASGSDALSLNTLCIPIIYEYNNNIYKFKFAVQTAKHETEINLEWVDEMKLRDIFKYRDEIIQKNNSQFNTIIFSNKIPQKIIQIKNQKTNNITLFPDYQYQYFVFGHENINDYLVTHFDYDVWETFLNILSEPLKYIFFVYCFLYNEGGIYCNMTCKHINPNVFENCELVLTYNINFIACIPKHQILYKCIQYIMSHVKNNTNLEPDFLKKIVESSGVDNKTKILNCNCIHEIPNVFWMKKHIYLEKLLKPHTQSQYECEFDCVVLLDDSENIFSKYLPNIFKLDKKDNIFDLLDTLLEIFNKDTHNSIFIQMDLYGDEFLWIQLLSDKHLSKISKMVITFHGILNDQFHSKKIKMMCLEKLSHTHNVVCANPIYRYNVCENIKITYQKKITPSEFHNTQ